MDYAYVPHSESDTFVGLFKEFYKNRPNTTMLDASGEMGHDSLERGVDALNALGAALPIGDLFLCSHGNERGWLELRVLAILKDPVSVHYEDIESAMQQARLVLQPGTTKPWTGAQIGTTIRFRACRIGHAAPFVELLKSAFGGRAHVCASKHFMGYQVLTAGNQRNIVEYLAYNFQLTKKSNEPLKKRADVISAFQGAGLKDYKGTAISANMWDKWVPTKAPTNKTKKDLSIPVDANGSLKMETEFRAEQRSAKDPVPFTGANPTQDAAKQAALIYLGTLPTYVKSNTNKFPVYERESFASLSDYVNAHSWKQSDGKLVGSRMDYTVIVPIVDPATGFLLHNLVPTGPGPLNVRNGIDEKDANLFWNG